DRLEAIVQESAPKDAGHDFAFSADVKRSLFKRFCTEEAALAFFRRNLWIDKYVWQSRRRAESLAGVNDSSNALNILSSLSFYMNQKSEVPFKILEGRSSTHSAWRIIRQADDDRLIDDIMEFGRSIAIAQLETKLIRIDTYEGWELVESAVNAVVRRAF